MMSCRDHSNLVFPDDLAPCTRETKSEGLNMIESYLKHNDIVSDTHRAFVDWYTNQLPKQIRERSIKFVYDGHAITAEGNIKYSYFGFMDVLVTRRNQNDNPNVCMRQGRDFLADIKVKPCVRDRRGKIIGQFASPIVLGSFLIPGMTPGLDFLEEYKNDPEKLVMLGSDADYKGCDFIVGGNRYVMPYIERLRLDQIQVYSPSPKAEAYSAKQTFVTPTSSTMVKLIQRPDTGEICMSIGAFGNAPKSFQKISLNNTVNVIYVAALIDRFYKRSREDVPISKGEGGMKRIADLLERYVYEQCPFPDNEHRKSLLMSKFRTTYAIGTAVQGHGEFHKTIDQILQWKSNDKLPPAERQEIFKNIVSKEIFPTATTKEQKLRMLATMIGRLLDVVCGGQATDKNKFSYRKLDSYAFEFAKNFRRAYSSLINNIQNEISNIGKYGTAPTFTIGELVNMFRSKDKYIEHIMCQDFRPNAKSSGNRALKTENTTNLVDSVNPVHIMSLITKDHITIDKKTKSMKIRGYHPTQPGTLCPYTPDDHNCGLVKYKTIGARISHEIDVAHYKATLEKYGVISPKYDRHTRNVPVVLNGKTIGFCSNAKVAQDTISRMRRSKNYPDHSLCGQIVPHGLIDPYVTVALTEFGHVEMYGTSGRVLKPLIFVENGESIIESQKLLNDNTTFEDLLSAGAVGYIDDLEAESFLIRFGGPEDIVEDRKKKETALREIAELEREMEHMVDERFRNELNSLIEQIKQSEPNTKKERSLVKRADQVRKQIREQLSDNKDLVDRYAMHMNTLNQMAKQPLRGVYLHGSVLTGVGVSSVTMPGYEASCRTHFAFKFLSQAMSNWLNEHLPISGRYSLYPRTPLTRSTLSNYTGLGSSCVGRPASVLIATTRENEEDAVVVSQSYARNMIYKRIYVIKSEVNLETEEIHRPDVTSSTDATLFRNLAKDGYPTMGMMYRKGDIILGKRLKGENSMGGREKNVTLDKHNEGRVVDVYSYQKESRNRNNFGRTLVVVIHLEVIRAAEKGDKISLSGQKFTISSVKPDRKMMFMINGTQTRVDVIVNPHAIPSRMTIGMLYEMIFGRATTMTGLSIDGTIFEGRGQSNKKLDAFYRFLEANGHNRHGNVTVARKGVQLEGDIFYGECQMLQIHHVSIEKTHGCSMGKYDAKGRRIKDSATRFGEMEKDAALTLRLANLVHERMCLSADGVEVPVCLNCGYHLSIAIDDAVRTAKCSDCGQSLDNNIGRLLTTKLFRSLCMSARSKGIMFRTLVETDEQKYQRRLEELSTIIKRNKKGVPTYYGKDHESSTSESRDDESRSTSDSFDDSTEKSGDPEIFYEEDDRD